MRLGFGTASLVELARRLTILAIVAALLSGLTIAIVQSVATQTIRQLEGGAEREAERAEVSMRWARLDLSIAPGEMTTQLIIVAIAALAGRKILRLRL
jgi:hypothetical protein